MFMAMPSGNVVISDKMQFPGGGGGVAAGGGGGGGEMFQPHHRQWFPDERDRFISWLRGEFAAANAIIDSMCHHLRLVGEPGEYDGVIGCIQQRRCNWNPVLHMQQYFSVAEVLYALQQVTFRRQQRFYDPVKGNGGKEFKPPRSGTGSRGGGGHRFDVVKDGQNQNHNHNQNSSVECYNSQNNANVLGNSVGDEAKVGSAVGKLDDKDVTLAKENNGADASIKPQVDSCVKIPGNVQSKSDCEGNEVNAGDNSNSKETSHEKKNLSIIAKTFVGTEMLDGKEVNVVDGMKLYEDLLDDSELGKLVALVNDLRTAGRQGQFQGQTFVAAKRPTKGHGREMIQLGLPIADAPCEYEPTGGTSKDRRIEPIPSLLQDVIERLRAMQVVNVKPDSCIIDIYNEGDHSQPHMWPNWFGRPVCVLFLTECDVTFGKVIGVDHPGDFRGSLKLSLAPGSMLVMQGKSADLARHAIPSIRKQRVLVTLTKSQPKKTPSEVQRFPSVAAGPPSHWVPPPSRSPNHVRHPAGPKHYVPVPTTGVLPAPAGRPQLPPPNGIQPIFVPAAVAPAMPFPAPVALPPSSAGWPAAAPMRHPPPRLPVPGTGVFLPPGSSNSLSQPSSTTAATESFSTDTDDSGKGKADGNSSTTSPKGKVDAKVLHQDCNGNVDGTGGKKTVSEEELQQNDDPKVTN